MRVQRLENEGKDASGLKDFPDYILRIGQGIEKEDSNGNIIIPNDIAATVDELGLDELVYPKICISKYKMF